MNEHRKRSLMKTITWRAIATTTTMALVFLSTGELTLTLSIGALDVIFKLIFYYAHERAWNVVPWGKNRGKRTWNIVSRVKNLRQK